MAGKSKKWKKISSIKDTENGGFGTYKEDLGGGTPVGQPWKGQNGRIGWDNRERSGEVSSPDHREKQPRTSDGKFTYNSVNGKETKYESRGKTVNPLLTEGQNGIYIDDANKAIETEGKHTSSNMSQQMANYIFERYQQGKFYKKGNVLITRDEKGNLHRRAAANDIFNVARVSFDLKKGEFVGESESFKENIKGRPSKEQAKAMLLAKTSKGDQFVKDTNGKMHVKSGTTPAVRYNTGIIFNPAPGILANFTRNKAAVAAGMRSTPQQQLNSAVTQLKGGTQNVPNAISSAAIANLSNIANKFGANLKPSSLASNVSTGPRKPKVSVAGFFGNK